MSQGIETADKLDKLEAESIYILREAYKKLGPQDNSRSRWGRTSSG